MVSGVGRSMVRLSIGTSFASFPSAVSFMLRLTPIRCNGHCSTRLLSRIQPIRIYRTRVSSFYLYRERPPTVFLPYRAPVQYNYPGSIGCFLPRVDRRTSVIEMWNDHRNESEKLPRTPSACEIPAATSHTTETVRGFVNTDTVEAEFTKYSN